MLQRIGRRLRREWERQERWQRLPERSVLLLTNPRSGSTWLFDALRCHPGLIVNAEADLWQYLGMRGRRYPKDLRGDTDNAVRIEVRPGEWESLPRYVLPSALTIRCSQCGPSRVKALLNTYSTSWRSSSRRGLAKHRCAGRRCA